jgi:hypothetical protein
VRDAGFVDVHISHASEIGLALRPMRTISQVPERA